MTNKPQLNCWTNSPSTEFFLRPRQIRIDTTRRKAHIATPHMGVARIVVGGGGRDATRLCISRGTISANIARKPYERSDGCD